MRLYRGKRIDNGEEVKGWLLKNYHDQYFIVEPIQIHVSTAKIASGATDLTIIGCFEVIPETVGQSTGLKDKNGKDLDWWEGDRFTLGNTKFRHSLFGQYFPSRSGSVYPVSNDPQHKHLSIWRIFIILPPN